MSILNVLVSPNPILRQKASIVSSFDATLLKLVSDMYDTCIKYKGIGLAAPQVGVLQRVLVVMYKKRHFALVNPKIIQKSSATSMREEGCLSLPTLLVDVVRAKSIVVEAQDEFGKPVRLEESGLVATIIQHEMDHLEGILITDYGSPKPLDEGVI